MSGVTFVAALRQRSSEMTTLVGELVFIRGVAQFHRQAIVLALLAGATRETSPMASSRFLRPGIREDALQPLQLLGDERLRPAGDNAPDDPSKHAVEQVDARSIQINDIGRRR